MAETVNWADLMDQAGEEVSSSFEPLPAGEYDFEVVASEAKVSSNGNKMWKNQYKVLGGDHNNRRVFDNLTLVTSSQQSLGFFFSKMAVLGLTRAYFATQPTDEQVAAAAVGRRFRARVKQEIYNGETQNKIDRYIKPIELAGPPIPPAPTATVSAAGEASSVPAPPVPEAQPPAAPVAGVGTPPPPPPLEGLPF